jgi:uncharacterized protein (DUF58 family)
MRRLLRPATALLVAALALRVDPLVGMAVGLAGWAALSWWLPRRSIDTIELRKKHPRRVFHGDTVAVEYEVGSDRTVPWVSLVDPVPFALGPSVRWVTSLQRNGRASHRVEFRASRRGLHRLGPTVVSSGDTFGARTVQGRPKAATRLLVYPRIEGIERLGLTPRALEQIRPTKRPSIPDPTRVVGVRDYVAGDTLRHIHWTASARVGSLQVKKLQPSTARTVVLAVDLSWPHHPAPGRRRSMEIGITAASSIAHHLVTVSDESVGLRAWCTDSPTGRAVMVDLPSSRGTQHLSAVLEHLARADLVRREAPGVLLDPANHQFGSSVVLFTGVIGEGHVAPLIRLRRIGHEVSVVTTAGDRHQLNWVDPLVEAGVVVTPVSFYEEMAAL